MPEDETPDPPPSGLDLDEIIRHAPDEKEIRTKREPPPTPPPEQEPEPEHPKERSE
jgi:hypothetical protein